MRGGLELLLFIAWSGAFRERPEIHMTSLIWTLIVGGVAGWLASIVMKTNAQMGVLANIVVGIIGSWLGFWLAGVLGLHASGLIAGLLVRVAGAMLLIAILKGFRVLR